MGKDSCPISKENRINIDSVVKKLHEDQSGGARHRCCYCAYELGVKEGYERAKKEAAKGSF